VKGLLGKMITFCKHQAKGGWQLDLKFIYEFIKLLKWKVIIRNEIMIRFRHSTLTTNNQKPYMDDEWHMLKDKHKMDKMLISILDSKFDDDFYLKKMKLNPLDKVHPLGFKCMLEKWIQSGNSKDNVIKAIMLENQYKFD